MINEQNSKPNNTQTSTNISYRYPTNLMQNPNDLYSYYPTNVYQPFGTFDEYNRWGSNEDSSNSLPHSPPQLYSSSNHDLFDYSSYPTANDFSWNLSNLNYQSAIPVIGNNNNNNNRKSTIGDRCDILAQQMNSIHLTNLHEQLNSNANLSITRPSGPKSYASVVSSDRINSTQKKSNVPIRTMTNEINHSSQIIAKKTDQQYNPKDFNLNPKGARFFVIKSYSEDDVHRSIKYNIWCSTEHGNKRLDRAFREREGKGPIYLFFSVNASGHFCGIAEMISPVDYEHQTDIWHMSNKWQGKFEVKWFYVKDVPNQQFRNIRLENNENKPVTNSRDTQEIPYEEGKLMLKMFHMYRHKTSIFDDFQYYESKQAEENTSKQTV